MYYCTLCYHYSGRSFSDILRHIGIAHRYDPGLSIRCGIKSCPSVYTNYDSYRSHVYRKHRDELFPSDAGSNSENQVCETLDSSFPLQDSPFDSAATEIPPADSDSVCKVNHTTLKFNAAKFLLKTKEECKLTQSSVDVILSGVKGLWRQAMDDLQSRIADSLPDGVDESIFSICPFEGLETQFLQQKFYKEHFSYVAPVERVLGRELCEKNGRAVEVVDCCYDIPLHESLQAMLRMNVVRDQVMNSHSLSNGLMGDYCDGDLYARNALFIEDPCALQLQLYYDELELCNPLGSKTHKLGLFYYTLGNLDPVLRSSLKNIHLLCAVKYEFMQKYGVEKVMQPIVESIMELEKEEGVKFDFDGQDTIFRGTLTVFSADNLAAWSIGGFKTLASAFRRCQFCMVTMEDMQEKFTEEDLQLRTRQLYKTHCEGLEGPLASHISTTYGIANNSVLNQCKYFHVTEGLVPDIMHDVLEGSLSLCVKHLLIQLISEDKLFALDLLNRRLSSFSYGSTDCKNRPSEISPRHLSVDSSLRQSAAQMWCLGRYLPILIGDLVPEEHTHWENFLTLLDIVNELFAPVTNPDRADYLSVLIGDFLEQFKDLYPTRPLTPKMHYMVHMPSWMKRCGPLVRQWCMRYEAKHNYFKHLARVLGNFKNISKTLANRHQLYMCYQMLDPATYMTNQVSYAGAKRVKVENLVSSVEVQLAVEELNGESEVFRVSTTTVNGISYKRGVVLACDFVEDQLVFGRVLDLLVTPSQECLFVLSVLETYHNRHFHCIEIAASSDEPVLVCRYHNLIDYYPLNVCQQFGCNSKLCFCMKYNVLSK